MAINIGSTPIKKVYVGTTTIKRGYIGSTEIFGDEEVYPIPTVTSIDMIPFTEDSEPYTHGFAQQDERRYTAYGYSTNWYSGRSFSLTITGTDFVGCSVASASGVAVTPTVESDTSIILDVSINDTGYSNLYGSVNIAIRPWSTSGPVQYVTYLYITFYYGVCFSEDTLITMGDSSRKPIREVVSGDVIKTYSPRFKKCYDVRVIQNMRGVGIEYRKITLEDGRELKVFGDTQRLYCAEEKRQKHIAWFKEGEHLVDILGHEVAIVRIEKIVSDPQYHYALITDTTLYLANNIVVGHCDGPQYHHIVSHDEIKSRYTESEIEDFKSRSDYFNEYHAPQVYDATFAKKYNKLKDNTKKDKMIKDHQKEMKKMNHKQWKEMTKMSHKQWKEHKKDKEE